MNYRNSAAVLPSIALTTSYAPGKVWKGSTTGEARFAAMPKRRAVRLYHDARRFERQTRKSGHQDGALGRNGLAVLHALVFDFLNYASGRLDPSYEAIARAANVSVRSAARGLAALKAAGVLNWVRRCAWAKGDSRSGWVLNQESNAYAVIPPTQWRGYRAPPDPPPPEPGTWGAPQPNVSAIGAAATELAHGQHAAARAALESDPGDKLAGAIARLARFQLF